MINERAAKDGDTFTLKVFRRTNLASQLNVIAAFGDAKAIHFTSPELWITELAGGGKFNLLAFHNSDLSKPVGSYISFPVDTVEPRDVDLHAWKKSGWAGPVDLQFPKEPPARPQTDMLMYGIHSPPPAGAGPGDSATRQAWPRPAGGGLHRRDYEDESPFGAKAAAIEAERRKLEQEKLEAERERHRSELREAEKRHDAELKALEAKFDAKIAAARPTGPDPTQQLLVKMMEQQAEDRRQMEQRRLDDLKDAREREERRERERKEEREREERREEARQKEERDRQDRLERERREDQRLERERLDKMLERMDGGKKDPLEIAKQLTELVKSKGNDADVAMKSLHNVLEMQSTVMGSAMDFVQAASTLQLGGGENEPGWLKGIDKLVKGFGKMALARPPQLPFNGTPQQPQMPQGQRAPPPQQPPAQPPAQPTIADQIAQGIREYHPPHLVAKAILAYYQDPSIQQLLIEAGGDFEAALLKRLGNWPNENAAKNQPYLAALVEALKKELEKAGYMEPDEPETAAEDEDDEPEDAQVEEGDEPDDE